jgi:nucleotide-binding universal stress UspA family protein
MVDRIDSKPSGEIGREGPPSKASEIETGDAFTPPANPAKRDALLDPKSHPLRLRHFLIPLDGSPLADAILPSALALAEVFSARVTLLRVLEAPASPPGAHVNPVEWELVRAEAQHRLGELKSQLEARGLQTAAELVEGRAAEQILLFADQHDVDLIALSSHGEGGLSGWFLSSTIQKVVARTHRSLFIAPAYAYPEAPHPAPRFAKILLPLDCSPRAECAVLMAMEIAAAHQSEMILAHVVAEPELSRRMAPCEEDLTLAAKLTRRNREEAERYLMQLQENLTARGVRSRARVVVSARRAHSLRALAQHENVDLVVLSAHGRTGDPADRYGGVASRVIQECPRPVMIVQDLAHEIHALNAAEETARGHPGH